MSKTNKSATRAGCLAALFPSRMFSESAPAGSTATVDPDSPVEEREVLFRGIKPQYITRQQGLLRPTSQAFTDPTYRVSVDRAVLCRHDPYHAQISTTNFVCSVIAEQVRAIGEVRKMKNDVVETQYQVLVMPEVLPHNPAHAVIYADPEISSDKVFKRLQVALARLAKWEIEPPDSSVTN